ncbi:MAG: hypothetical protein IPK19_25295 [Chloroflexi bacterium]|nr:hypothetical protein [Chloroflexota bacterium]
MPTPDVLNSGQIRAPTDWVASGGHLIVTGGANSQATAAGLSDLLPLCRPDRAEMPDPGRLADGCASLICRRK